MLRVSEDACQVLRAGQLSSVGYLSAFPSPRTERISPGHLVAVAATANGDEAVVWRWYDAVVLGEETASEEAASEETASQQTSGQETGLVRLWEPAHGEVLARRRRANQRPQPGTRAYLSAGLRGADWWLAGAAVANPEDADVELDEVERFCTEHDLWPSSV